jgi:hypothetical protein
MTDDHFLEQQYMIEYRNNNIWFLNFLKHAERFRIFCANVFIPLAAIEGAI